MPLAPNSNLRHYRLLSQIGEGGMGVVWKAVDTTLDREVAVKILPEQFATDAERLARFEREAKLLASLNHPNIAAVYGLHEAEGVRFLVMELVDGDDLAERLKAGPLPVDDALEAAGQIAAALEAAHEAGVIHRDLKPANVVINNEGQVKVLDFGLAKALDPTAGESSGDPSLSPTLTSAGTVAGMILGTAAYMSPEQARGKSVDSRTDIWAFGCVLYELLTGRQMFQGETVTDVLGAILHREPDWDALPAGLPRSIHRLLRRCLERDQRKRRRDIGDARIVIEEAVAGKWEDEGETEAVVPVAGMFRSPWALITAVLALILIGALMGKFIGGGGTAETSSGTVTTAHVELVLPDDGPVAIGSFLPAMTWIPDESGIVYVGLRDGVRRLYVRKLDDPVPVELPGTEGAEGPFVSPDSQWIGFYAEFALRKVPTGGGTPQVIIPVRDFRGAAWGPGDRIVFADGQSTYLKQVNAAGGEITPLTELHDSEWSHRFPRFLPGGDAMLFCAQDGTSFHYEKGPLQVYSISEDRYVKLDGTGCDAAYAEPGRLLYIQGGALTAVPFDLQKLVITGPPETVVADVAIQINTGASQFAVSPAGSIAFAHGAALGDMVEVTRFDRQGKRSKVAGLDGVYRTPRLSTDGRQLLITGIGENITGVWKLELATGVHRRTLLDADLYAWDPDGSRVVYASDQRYGDQVLHRTAADFSGVPESLLKRPLMRLTDVTRDGRFALTIDGDLHTLPDGASEPEPFLETEAAEAGMRFSPDGRFVTYVSDESGRYEVYVAEFPGPGGKWQISNDGGRQPVWSRDGSEIFFRSRRRMLAVPVRTEPTFEAGGQQELFLGPYEGVLGQQGVPNYDVAGDRQSFIMLASPELQESQSRVGLLLRR